MQINYLIVVNCRGREFSDPSFTGNDWGLFSGRKENSYQSLDEKKKHICSFLGKLYKY